MKKQPPNPQFSAQISAFLRLMDQAKADSQWNQEEIGRLDRLTQDYLHMLELGNLNYAARAKVATQLADCRRLRRESKDTVEILDPLVVFLDSDKGRNMLNLMREVLGKTRKAEERMVGRVYRCRELPGDLS